MVDRRRTNKIILIGVGVCVALLLGCAGIAAMLGGEDTKNETRPAASTRPQDQSAAASAAGIPLKPDAATQAAYIADLNKINPDIVGQHSVDIMVDRGRSQCSSIGTTKDHAKLVELTNTRFSAPGHPNGFGTATAEQILAVVHTRICPTYPMP